MTGDHPSSQPDRVPVERTAARPDEPTSSEATPPSAPLAIVDHDLWQLFTRSDDGWTGADGSYSVPLPDGRTVWLFSDTFLGPVHPDRSRPRSAPFLHNSLIIQDGQQLITLHGGTAKRPRSLFVPTDGASWYWVYDGTVEGDRLHIFLLKFLRHGSGMFDWKWTGTDLATLRLPALTVETVVPLPIRNGVQYGAAMLEEPSHTYIYGVRDLGATKHGYVARAAVGNLRGPWEFFTARGWSPEPTQATPMLAASIGNEYSVTKTATGYVLVTIDTTKPLREWREIVAYVATRPTGPWVGPTVLYTAPEPDLADRFVYNAHAHPQLARPGELLITYNVNTLNHDELYDDADLYRARFIRVSLPNAPP